MASRTKACARATTCSVVTCLSDHPLGLFLACPRRVSFAPAGGFWESDERQHSPDRPLLPILLGDLLVLGLTLPSFLSSFPCCDSEFPIESFSTYSSTTMPDTKIRATPSHYPFLAFHLIRACSLVCSIIVSGILLYFCYWLKHDNYKIPWTFLVVRQSRLNLCTHDTNTFLSFSQYHSLP
jgi:hypothetical protein